MLESVQLGNSGLSVSRLCLGTMNFGEPGRGHQGDWTLTIDESRPIFEAALDNGLFYFDCADVYGLGACERVVGQLLRELLPRDKYVLSTKISAPMGKNPNQGGLSRKHIMEGIDACLQRLGLEYVDQLVIHRHPHGRPGLACPPIEETMGALDDVVKAGKALYIGGSSMFAWQFTELQMTAERHGWTKFISMQNHYNLIYREEEREMNPYCVSTGVALTPWSPLARGILTGSYRDGLDGGSTPRSQGADRKRTEGLYRGEMDFKIDPQNPGYVKVDRIFFNFGGKFNPAHREFLSLAERGHAGAEFMLGAMRFYGKGVQRNDALAAVWFHKSAIKGNPSGQLAFGSLHIRGLGVKGRLRVSLRLTRSGASLYRFMGLYDYRNRRRSKL